MKRIIFSLALVLPALLFGCQEAPLVQEETDQSQSVTASATTAAESDLSIYQLDSDWKNQSGQNLKLASLRGKPVVVSMVYTTCAFACPRTLADMQNIERGLSEYETDDFRMVLVTIDPERDTPAQLSTFASQYNLNLTRWTLLTSGPDQIQELAAVLNVKYRKALNGEFAHSNLITVLNDQGEIVHQQQGLGAAPDETIAIVKGLLSPH